MDGGVGLCPGTIASFSKRGYHLNHKRMDGLTQDNMEAMYEMTYETWVHARVAVKLLESEWHYVDDQGDKTGKQFVVGRLVKHKIIHPRWILSTRGTRLTLICANKEMDILERKHISQ